MTVVAGIDEAGYGPLLGPLVVAAAAYRLEDGAKESDVNRLVRDKTAREQGLATADSKTLFHQGGSLRRIESSTLGHIALGRGLLPVRVDGLLAGAVDLSRAELDELPWYGARLLQQQLPASAEVGDVLARAAVQRERLARIGAHFVDIFLAPVLEPRFNRQSTAAGTKAWTLFHATGRLIELLVARFTGEELVIHVDRQGGRIHYGDLLQTFFPLAPLTTVSEKTAESIYRLQWPGRSPVRIDFRVKADAGRAPVALASVAAKTVRELCMGALNAWFAERVEGLRPTAGYDTDGKRFLADVKPFLDKDRSGLRELLVRCR